MSYDLDSNVLGFEKYRRYLQFIKAFVWRKRSWIQVSKPKGFNGKIARCWRYPHDVQQIEKGECSV